MNHEEQQRNEGKDDPSNFMTENRLDSAAQRVKAVVRSNSNSHSAPETVITLRLEENLENAVSRSENFDEKPNGSGERNEGKANEAQEVGKCSCVIDVKCGDEKAKVGVDMDVENQRVCRICHLDMWESGQSSMELIELGCGCKGELGVAHLHCAEAWFKLRGNRLCEICGEIAENIKGVSDVRFMEDWNEGRSNLSIMSSAERRGCWRGQPLCNFLMACLIISFVLPWFFRVNMF